MALYNEKTGAKIEGMTIADYDASFGAGKAAAAGFTETAPASAPAQPPASPTAPPTAPPTPGVNPQGVPYKNTNRSLISDTPQAGYIKGYDSDQAYKEVFVPKDIYVPGISPKKPSINPQTLGTTEKSITVPGATDTTGGAGAMVKGASTELAEVMKQITPPTTEAETKQQTLLDQMASLTGEQGQKAADQLTAEESANVPQLKQQFADINAQILSKSAEYNVLQTENQNKPITMSSIIGNERAILNAKAADIGLLQARAQGLQGQLETAQNTANRAIDLKYSTKDAELNTLQAQLNALQPTLNKEEKLRAQAQQIILDRQKQALEDTKTAEKNQTNYLLDLMTKYPDSKISLTDSISTAQSKVSNSKIYQQDTRLVNGILGAGGSAPSGGGGVIPTNITPQPTKISSTTQAIIDNPSLFNDLTPTNRGKVISELQSNGYDTSNLGLKGLSDTAIKEISQTQKALEDLIVLKNTINDNLEFIGPISGWQKLNPWSKARQVQADVDRVKQTVGKALEGGVLRKEDEEKYKKILAQLTDTPDTAIYKIDQIITSLQKDVANYKSLQQSGGRSVDVGGSLTKKSTSTSTSTGATSGGNSYTVTKQ